MGSVRRPQGQRRIRCLLLIAAALFASLLAGCQSPLGGQPDRRRLDDLARTDAIELRTGDVSMRISDVAHIRRLNEIYANAHWKRYWHTLPAGVMDRTITLHSDVHEVRRLLYTGILWEMNAYDDMRTARLDSADRRWLESLFAHLPHVDDDGEPINAREPSTDGSL